MCSMDNNEGGYSLKIYLGATAENEKKEVLNSSISL